MDQNLENIRRALERGIAVAILEEDSKYTDMFQLALDNYNLYVKGLECEK